MLFLQDISRKRQVLIRVTRTNIVKCHKVRKKLTNINRIFIIKMDIKLNTFDDITIDKVIL